MGTNVWRDEHEWPLARTQYTDYFFHSDGRANSRKGDGTLTTATPGGEPSDSYVYNPRDPVPTRGGGLCCSPSFTQGGAFDQRCIEERPDVLVYTTPPLEQDLEVTGPVRVTLWASSSAPDTDWTAKLVDVAPDGFARNLTDGIIRARYRESLASPSLLQPGEIYEYTIDLWATSNVFKAGHRIRVDVSSSNFPRFDRNPNTGKALGEDAEMESALQRVYHDADRPSRITLPVIPTAAAPVEIAGTAAAGVP
jgi:putative CocE/NonD family hydrolase